MQTLPIAEARAQLADRIQRWRDQYLDVAEGADDPFDHLRQTEPGRDFAW